MTRDTETDLTCRATELELQQREEARHQGGVLKLLPSRPRSHSAPGEERGCCHGYLMVEWSLLSGDSCSGCVLHLLETTVFGCEGYVWQ